MKEITIKIRTLLDEDLIYDAINKELHFLALSSNMEPEEGTGGYIEMDWDFKTNILNEKEKVI